MGILSPRAGMLLAAVLLAAPGHRLPAAAAGALPAAETPSAGAAAAKDDVDDTAEAGADDSAAAPPAPEGPTSLGMELGYGWGFNTASFGHRFNANNNGDSFNYTYNLGEGVAARLEASRAVNDNLSVGLSLGYMPTDTGGSQALYMGVTTTTDTTHIHHVALPLLVMAHTRSKLGPAISIGTDFGVGPIFSQPYVEDTTQVVSDTRGVETAAIRYEKEMGTGMAFSSAINAEAQVASSLFLDLRADLFIARLPAVQANYYASFTNASGTQNSYYTANVYYVDTPPAQQVGVVPVTSTVGTTTTTTYDDGKTQYTDQVSHPGGGSAFDRFDETQTLPSGGTDDINYKVLSLTMAVRWVF
jgi:hypothetical protein